MDYTDSNFDDYFQRQVVPPPPSFAVTSPFDFSSQFSGFGANQISTGVMKSNNGHMTYDLDNEFVSISDGTQERVRLGKLQDGTYGIAIKDQNGNQLMNLSGSNNIISSSDGNMTLDFINTQLIIREANGNPIVLLGRQDNAF